MSTLQIMRGEENSNWKVGDIILRRGRRCDIIVSVIRRPTYPQTVALIRQMSRWEEVMAAWRGKLPIE